MLPRWFLYSITDSNSNFFGILQTLLRQHFMARIEVTVFLFLLSAPVFMSLYSANIHLAVFICQMFFRTQSFPLICFQGLHMSTELLQKHLEGGNRNTIYSLCVGATTGNQSLLVVSSVYKKLFYSYFSAAIHYFGIIIIIYLLQRLGGAYLVHRQH